MNYPTNITIKSYPYKIEYVETSREVDTDFESGHWLGQCVGETIRVLADQKPIGILDTLIHEVLHAVFNRNRMLREVVKSKNMEESFIDTLATELTILLIENGWIKQMEEGPPITKRII